jgi:hypothetical protein
MGPLLVLVCGLHVLYDAVNLTVVLCRFGYHVRFKFSFILQILNSDVSLSNPPVIRVLGQ